MTINGIGTNFSNYYTNVPTGGVQTASSSVTIQGIPSDVLEISSKSLFAGINTGTRLAGMRNNDIPNSLGSVSGSMFKVGRNSAIFSSVVSLAKNSFDFMNGSITGTRLGGNVTADVIGGIGSGILAAGAGSLATAAIGSGMGAGIVGFLIGTAAFVGSDLLYRNVGLYQTISDKVTGFIDKLLNREPPPGGW